jgi:hypothetical protein
MVGGRSAQRVLFAQQARVERGGRPAARLLAYGAGDRFGLADPGTPPIGPGFRVSVGGPIARGGFGARPILLVAPDEFRPPQADPAITLPIGLPPHPSYPSAHFCVSGCIHYRFDMEAGRALGRAVARTASATSLNSVAVR